MTGLLLDFVPLIVILIIQPIFCSTSRSTYVTHTFVCLPMGMLRETVSKALLKPRQTSTALVSFTKPVIFPWKVVRLIKPHFPFVKP